MVTMIASVSRSSIGLPDSPEESSLKTEEFELLGILKYGGDSLAQTRGIDESQTFWRGEFGCADHDEPAWLNLAVCVTPVGRRRPC
jgi:hypothetical protein